MEDYIKYELIGGGSPRYLKRSSNLSIVGSTLHTYQHYVVLILLTVSMHTAQFKTWEHTIPCGGSHSFL